jgi:hypothetical protein
MEFPTTPNTNKRVTGAAFSYMGVVVTVDNVVVFVTSVLLLVPFQISTVDERVVLSMVSTVFV